MESISNYESEVLQHVHVFDVSGEWAIFYGATTIAVILATLRYTYENSYDFCYGKIGHVQHLWKRLPNPNTCCVCCT